ncbi:MAG: hypothetical protein KBG20_03685 [Caldilineaceae bacterium]|nr:hypothetical protein [Caldilineaceae bacterium]MBP8106574.1 hypothetical protein [Caldilineaceae bacterium]MBP9071369.1 hypothetical protein [Caldilineaceae bacterium]
MPTKKERRAKRKAKRSAPPRPAPGRTVVESKGMGRLSRRVERGVPNAKIVQNAPGLEKMSDVLKRFVAPYAKRLGARDDSYRKLVAVAIVAWNAAIVGPDKEAEMLDDVEKTFPPDLRQDFRQIVEEMVARKKRHFANNRRLIIDCEVTDHGDEYHLAVISTPVPLDEMAAQTQKLGVSKKPSLWARIRRRFFKS